MPIPQEKMLLTPLDESQDIQCYNKDCDRKATHVSRGGVYTCTKQICALHLLMEERKNREEKL